MGLGLEHLPIQQSVLNNHKPRTSKTDPFGESKEKYKPAKKQSKSWKSLVCFDLCILTSCDIFMEIKSSVSVFIVVHLCVVNFT